VILALASCLMDEELAFLGGSRVGDCLDARGSIDSLPELWWWGR
jgi:hypothetical protein